MNSKCYMHIAAEHLKKTQGVSGGRTTSFSALTPVFSLSNAPGMPASPPGTTSILLGYNKHHVSMTALREERESYLDLPALQ